jgi:aminopeptidase N
VWVDDTTSVNRIFDGRLSYDKGGMLVHMLRWKLTDSTFFKGMRNYINDPKLAYGYAKTADLQRNLEAVSGQNLTEFFKDWFYGQGYPSYRVVWNQNGDKVNLQIFQTTSHPSVSFFEMPVQIQFVGASGQSVTLRLEHTANGQSFSAKVNFPVTKVIFDPDLWLISKNNQVSNGATATDEIRQLAAQVQVFPNPAQSELNVDFSNLAAKVYQMDILDTKGSLVKRFTITDSLEKMDISNISVGIYILKIQTDQGAVGKMFVKQ